ncbi:PREDICTED: LOW QUALITY PROTEIN: caspase recruitment domain-containing protein 17-like [Cercocebus atys]|uniref:LOW QUALITY PROTEIN: caspase recruitment domain-containing protein 17-like n=1 Tax=Cercocebus atys TaxID=9531 RepID=UPI0005F39BB3|nr:PREDICTED: LOW QUALITY PROTEIN: caspase recruitment domain-containing protein 17-like [Cercocebus atys]
MFPKWYPQHKQSKKKGEACFQFQPHKKGRREKPWPDKVLTEKRKLLIRSLDEGTINGLLGDLFETRVLNQEEIEIVKCKNATVMDKARALLDSVIRKGAPACQICVTYICEEDSHLAGTLRLSAAPQAVPLWGNPAMPTSSGSGRSVKLCSLDEAKRIWKEKQQRCHAQNTRFIQ